MRRRYVAVPLPSYKVAKSVVVEENANKRPWNLSDYVKGIGNIRCKYKRKKSKKVTFFENF